MAKLSAVSATQVLTIACAWGSVFAGLFCVIILGGMRVAPDAMLNDYPESVRAAYGKEQSATGRQVQRIMILLLMLAFIASTVGGVLAMKAAAGGDIGLWPAFGLGAVMILILHLVNLVILDWLVVGLLQPASILLPGTRGHPAFRDFWQPVRILFPRPIPWPILLIPITGLVIGGVVLLIEAIW